MRMLLRNFNSIKVRLEQRDLILNGSGLAKFQFHKGTIRTDYARYIYVPIEISIP